MTSWTTEDSLAGVRAGVDRCIERTRDLGQLERSAPAVSAWNVRDHLEHLYLSDRLVLRWVADALTRPNPEVRADSPREIGVSLLARGSIPRGRGPAPEFTLPTGLAATALRTGFEELRELAVGLARQEAELDACLHTLPHHVLGHFTLTEWLRFLHLHHRHHEAIVQDILDG
ncbi:DinB family protein [Candidatus Palauibacter sp.]|uniref:DinB family protein n=1 Tax=Candidatus Palauibacter sp. TaxID=3101350 RepID=UPI003B59CA83